MWQPYILALHLKFTDTITKGRNKTGDMSIVYYVRRKSEMSDKDRMHYKEMIFYIFYFNINCF